MSRLFGKNVKRAEAAREVERRQLFARLAERPEHVCPFLGLADARVDYRGEPDDLNRCYAFGEPALLDHEQQARVCLDRGYGNCPRYLRGILVIPTREIEALRRGRPAGPAEEETEPVPVRPPRRRFRRRLAAALALLVLFAGGGFVVAQGLPMTAVTERTPTPAPTVSPSPTPLPTVAPTPEPVATPAQTAGPTPEPTPEAGDRFSHYEVALAPGTYSIFVVSESGQIVDSREASFAGYSRAPVEPRQTPSGLVHWETVAGNLSGWSYIYPDSGDFVIRAVFLTPQGERRVSPLPDEERTTYPTSTPTP